MVQVADGRALFQNIYHDFARGQQLRNMAVAFVRRLANIDDSKDAIRLFMNGIEIQFIADVKQNQHAARHADGKSSHIDERVGFVLPNVSCGDFEIVFEI
jgi:hypothetical protein